MFKADLRLTHTVCGRWPQAVRKSFIPDALRPEDARVRPAIPSSSFIESRKVRTRCFNEARGTFVVIGEAVFCEQVALAPVHEQCRGLAFREFAGRGDVFLNNQGVVFHHANLRWEALGPCEPNADAGRAPLKKSAPRAPGRAWASDCAGITPSENPA